MFKLLQGLEFAKKEKWKKNSYFWQNAKFARNGISNRDMVNYG